MGCLGTVIVLLMPRTALVFIWILTDWTTRAFETHFWPFIGFLFFPYTTLAYLAAMISNNHHVSGGWLFLVMLALLFDVVGGARKLSDW